MGIFDTWKKSQQLLLNENDIGRWPEKILEHKDIPREINRFLRQFEKARDDVSYASNALLDEHILKSVPERAQHITTEYAKHLDVLTRQALENMEFTTDAIAFHELSGDAVSEIAQWRELTTKHNAALKEFLQPQLSDLAKSMQELEDLIINTGSQLEEKGFGSIMTVRDLINQFLDEEKKRQRYERTLNKYLQEKEENDARKEKHETKIENQRSLIRSKEAVEALRNVSKIEEDQQRIRDRYERLIFDTKHYLLKHGLMLSEETKKIFVSLKKDPDGAIIKQHDVLKKEFKELHGQISELHKEDKRSVVDRLKEAAEDISKDARKLVENQPQLHELKKQILNDIAALNIYEQQQFLNRVERDGADIQEKIDFISEELQTVKSEELMDEIVHVAKLFQPVIKHKEAE